MEKKLIKNKKIKKIWTNNEDTLLKIMVKKEGPKKWTNISKYFPGREGKQCRERWFNHLNPEISKSSWTEEEEWLLFLWHKIYGNKWAFISIYIPTRTDNTIKNHWNSIMKKKLKKLEKKLEFYIENKENLVKEPEIFELINKIQKGIICKNNSKKGRKTKEEFNKYQLIYSNQEYLKSIKNFKEEKLSNTKTNNFQDEESTKSKKMNNDFENTNFLNATNYLDISTPISKNNDNINNNYSNEIDFQKNNFFHSNFNSNIKLKSNNNEKEEIFDEFKYSDLCFQLFN